MILDYNKLQRPERSGVLAVLIVYLALCFYGEANWDHSLIDGDWSLGSLACMLFPWECMKQPKVIAIAHEEESEPRHVTLLYCPSCPVTKHKRCKLHLDFRDSPDSPINHYYLPEHYMVQCPDPIDRYSSWWMENRGWPEEQLYNQGTPRYYRWHVTVSSE